MVEFTVETKEVEHPVVKNCQGQIYRYVREVWIGSDGDVNFNDRFRWIKKLSCPGCEKCEWLKEHISFFLHGYYNEMYNHNKVETGKLYKLTITNISTDWETGYVDDWDLEFVPYKDGT